MHRFACVGVCAEDPDGDPEVALVSTYRLRRNHSPAVMERGIDRRQVRTGILA